MILVQPFKSLDSSDLRRVASGYTSDGKYVVTHTDSEDHTSIDLHFGNLTQPYVRRYDHYDDDTLQRYQRVLNDGYSFGAYDDGKLVGLLIAEARHWNRSLWVWEYHVAEAHRRMGIGRRLMECAAEKARIACLRTIVCETQTTNATAIAVYRRLGFRIEGVDISYYSNNDYPDGEIAIFMKRRLP